MGMLVALAAEGLIPLNAALPILYGQNIGTCVTSLLSSIGANKNAKRAAVIHLIFNVLGTVLFLIFLNKPVVSLVTGMDPGNVARQIANTHTLFNIISVLILLPFNNIIIKMALNKPVVSLVTGMDPGNVARQIANTHTLFNIISVLILLPFNNIIIKMAMRIIPDKAEDEEDIKTVKYIDDKMLEIPSIALINTIKETIRCLKYLQ